MRPGYHVFVRSLFIIMWVCLAELETDALVVLLLLPSVVTGVTKSTTAEISYVITPQNCIYVDAVARQSVLHKNLRPGVKGVAIWSLSLTLPSVHPTLSAITLISSQQVTVTVFHSATNRFHGKQSKATGTKKTQSRANTLEQTQQHWQICITHRHDEMQHTPCLFTPTVTYTVWTMGMCPPKSKQRTVSHLWM